MTDDDAILKQLGARVREQRAEERTETSASAGVPAFDAAAEERIAARLLGTQADAKVDADADAEAKADAARGGVVVRPRRWVWAAAPLAAAAAIALFVATRGASVAQPPTYELLVTSVSELRDPSAPKPKAPEVLLDPDGELDLVARPAAPVKGARARAVLVGPTGAQPWLVPVDISDQGAVRITGPTHSLFPRTSGSYEIVIVIGVDGAAPTQEDALGIASEGATEATSYRVVRSKVRFGKE